MTRKKLARLIWKLWKKRNYYKKWYEYEVEERKFWLIHLDVVHKKLKELKDEGKFDGIF